MKEALFLIMYEPWAMTIDLDAAGVDFTSHPEHPNVSKLAVHSTKKDRTGGAILTIIQSVHLCLRALFARYLAEKSLDSLLNIFLNMHVQVLLSCSASVYYA
jgi:hypothetical protein